MNFKPFRLSQTSNANSERHDVISCHADMSRRYAINIKGRDDKESTETKRRAGYPSSGNGEFAVPAPKTNSDILVLKTDSRCTDYFAIFGENFQLGCGALNG